MNNASQTKYDALHYLQTRPLERFARGHVIYSGQPQALYLVAWGTVKLTTTTAGGQETVIRFVRPEGLFGEACLIPPQCITDARMERAVALERVELMAWSPIEVAGRIEREPALGLALIQQWLTANLELQDRLQAMAICATKHRVMLALLQLARRLGQQEPVGTELTMPALTHQLIADYVCTSREIVSTHMNHLRRLGLIRYTRKQITVDCEGLDRALGRRAIERRRQPQRQG